VNPQTQAIFEAAMALPQAERDLLIERLLETLSDDAEELTDDELAAELDRRRAEIMEGKVKPIPWSDIRLGE
jgi:putative addiction module component (TIGR02574 family)